MFTSVHSWREYNTHVVDRLQSLISQTLQQAVALKDHTSAVVNQLQLGRRSATTSRGMAGSPKNCVSDATPYSRYVSSRKRLIIFASFFLFFSDKDCVQYFLINSLKVSGIHNPKRKKSMNPILTWVYQKYAKITVRSLYQKKTRKFTIFY